MVYMTGLMAAKLPVAFLPRLSLLLVPNAGGGDMASGSAPEKVECGAQYAEP